MRRKKKGVCCVQDFLSHNNGELCHSISHALSEKQILLSLYRNKLRTDIIQDVHVQAKEQDSPSHLALKKTAKIDVDCLYKTKSTLGKAAERNPWEEQKQKAPRAAQQDGEILQEAFLSVPAESEQDEGHVLSQENGKE